MFSAVVGNSNYAESLSGTGVAGGKRTHTAKGFNYNSSSSNIISTGSEIVDMSGGSSSSISGGSVIDGKKWMAMANLTAVTLTDYYCGYLLEIPLIIVEL